MLEGDGAQIRPIFNEHEGFLHPTYKHTGVLWALETMAWDPSIFDAPFSRSRSLRASIPA